MNIGMGMYWAGWILFVGVTLWIVPPVISFVMRRLNPVTDFADADCPSLTVVVPARNEECAIEQALHSLLKSDYPSLRIIAVNDRSTDRTAELMELTAAADSRCTVVHIRDLPAGWLGKNHAMHLAAQQTDTEYLLFTDGDVIYEPQALRSALAFATRHRLDHLCLMPRMIPGAFFENCVVSFFGLAFAIGQQIHLIRSSLPFAYAGVGAFNLIRTELYCRMDGHRRIAMDVLDDVKLGKLVKQHHGRQDFIGAPRLLSIRWYPSLSGVIRGLEKNGFAALNYSVASVVLCTVLFFATMIAPYVVPWFAPLTVTGGFLATAILWQVMYGVTVVSFGGSAVVALFFPISATLLSFAFWRSAWVTLKQNGVRWRESFYSLEDLRAGLYR